MYKLLIVDDNRTHIDCVTDYIDWAKLGFTEIKTASNGEEALEIFNDFCPELVITDVVMPRMTGPELAENIRKTDKNTHVIFMSCYEDFEYVKHAIDNDITAYILKPIEPDKLIEAAEKVLRNIEERNKMISTERAVKESLLYRFLYQHNPEIPSELMGYTEFENIKQALIVKYNILNAEKNASNPYILLDSIYDFFDSFEVNAIPEIPDKVIVMISSSRDEFAEFSNNAIDSIRRHINFAMETDKLEIAAGVSNVFDSIKHAHTMLGQASRAFEGTYSPIAGEIYFFEDFEGCENEDSGEFDVYMLRHDLSELLNNGTEAPLESFMDKYYPQNININHNSIKALCFTTITTLQLLLTERNADINNLFESPDIIWTKLNKFDTIKDTYHWLKNILSACCEFVCDLEKKNKHKIIKDIIDYINGHYKDISSVSQIASELFISTGYAKNVFKKHTGQTIFDYLVDKRILEAKKLLSDPAVKVYEVSQMVGYTSKSHFAETFKRKTGMTPKEFQQK